MLVDLFGGGQSPSCAKHALKGTSEDNLDAITVETGKKSIYVVGYLRSVPTETATIHVADQLHELL